MWHASHGHLKVLGGVGVSKVMNDGVHAHPGNPVTIVISRIINNFMGRTRGRIARVIQMVFGNQGGAFGKNGRNASLPQGSPVVQGV
jgi:hypothetical protein